MWPNQTLTRLLGIDLPIIQAPMAGASGPEMAIAVCSAGGLGSLPFAMHDVDKAREEIRTVQQQTTKPFNINFFCHDPAKVSAERDAAWKQHLNHYYEELGLDINTDTPDTNRAPFDNRKCELIEELKPKVVSFHFGLPDRVLLKRVSDTGAIIISSATTVAEARWLEDNGCHAVIAQGAEAGGHRGIFLSNNIAKDIMNQPGTFALVPQVVDAINIPVIAAGGIADGRGIAAAFALGASAVQIGTAYLFTPEATITNLHRTALNEASDDQTAMTNLFSGRPARSLMNRIMRELGPMSKHTPVFPTAGAALAPLKAKAEADNRHDFSSLWSGQAAALGHKSNARELTLKMAADTKKQLQKLAIEPQEELI